MTYAVLRIPRPAFEEIRERLLERQPAAVRLPWREVEHVDAQHGAGILIGAGSPSALLFVPLDRGADGAYPRDPWQTPGLGPMDAVA